LGGFDNKKREGKMNKMSNHNTLRQRLLATISRTSFGLVGAGTLLMAAVPNSAKALNLYDGTNSGNNLEINLTTTLSYTGALRVNNPSAVLKSAEDGDANFQHGIVTDLFSAVPVLDIRDGDFGAHFSGQFYLNTPYLGTNQNDLKPYSSAIYTGKQTDFTSATRNVDGENAQVLDAFVFGQHQFADGQTIQVKLGRSVLFWGQSLYFPSDGISGGQSPIDVVSAQNLVNPQAQQVFMPVGQAIVTYQPRPGTTIQGYYQFEWAHDYFQGAGAYFNGNNLFDKGAGYLTLANLGTSTEGLTRTKDLAPEHQNGQFGLSFQQEVGAWDLGIYGERFDAKGPEIGILGSDALGPVGNPSAGALSIGNYQLVYPRDTWLQGVSFSTNLGPANVAGEFSVREHQPLVSNNNGVFILLPGQNANSSPGYPVGNTWDAQLSSIYVTPGIPLDPGGVSIAAEIILNHLINVTQNRWPAFAGGTGLCTGCQATAGAFDVSVTPTYNDVLPNLQVTFPIGLTYDYLGRSAVDSQLYHGTGTFDAGVTATYKVSWIASLAYQDYLGKPDVNHNYLADRGYVSLNLQYTF
jgi:hypothetical protein